MIIINHRNIYDVNKNRENKINSKKEYDANIKKASKMFFWMTIFFVGACTLNLSFDNLGFKTAYNFTNDFCIPLLSALYIPTVYAMIGKYFNL